MSLKLGSTSIGSLYLGSTKIAEAYLGSTKVYASAAPVDPYNPLGLPANTMRVKLAAGSDPTGQDWATQTSLVDATENIWDITVSDFEYLGSSMVYYACPPIEILGANTTGVTSLAGMCSNCTTLTSVALFDTRSVTDMSLMFSHCNLTTLPLFPTGSVTDMSSMCLDCSALTAIPLFDTSSATNVDQAFLSCENVEHGALALYQQMSTQATPPSSHMNAFGSCGSNTATGAAELAQIPKSWGGTGA